MKALLFAGMLAGGVAIAAASLAAPTPAAPAKTQSAIDRRFDKLDVNHDGKLTPDELSAGRRVAVTAKSAAFTKLDTDHDGAIERTEFETRMTAAAGGAKARGAGRVTRAERQTAQPAPKS